MVYEFSVASPTHFFGLAERCWEVNDMVLGTVLEPSSRYLVLLHPKNTLSFCPRNRCRKVGFGLEASFTLGLLLSP